MSANPMAWEGGVNARLGEFPKAQGCMLPMGVTSENVAAKYGISRRTQDEFAVGGCWAVACLVGGCLVGWLVGGWMVWVWVLIMCEMCVGCSELAWALYGRWCAPRGLVPATAKKQWRPALAASRCATLRHAAIAHTALHRKTTPHPFFRSVVPQVKSHRKAAAAQAAGRFRDEIVPVATKLVDPKSGAETPVTVRTRLCYRNAACWVLIALLDGSGRDEGWIGVEGSRQASPSARILPSDMLR